MGFIVRPLGALIFGYIGDKYGRNRTLTIAIVCVSGRGGPGRGGAPPRRRPPRRLPALHGRPLAAVSAPAVYAAASGDLTARRPCW